MANTQSNSKKNSLIGMIACGLILLIIGFVMNVNNGVAVGKGLGRHSNNYTVNWIAPVCIGSSLLILGLILLIAKKKDKK